MNVAQIKKLAKIRLGNIAISKDEDAILSFINLGVAELYRRFNLRIKPETIHVNDSLALYSLRSSDVLMLLMLFDKAGKTLTQTDILNSTDYDYKQVSYNSFLLRKPFNGLIYAIYKASSTPLVDDKDEVELPDAMLDALLSYIAYMGYYTINKDNMNEANVYFQRFEFACTSLVNQGYDVGVYQERLSLFTKGFV